MVSFCKKIFFLYANLTYTIPRKPLDQLIFIKHAQYREKEKRKNKQNKLVDEKALSATVESNRAYAIEVLGLPTPI